MSKGLELPVSAIIVIAIAMLVLVAVGTFFFGNASAGSRDISFQAGFADGCTKLRSLYDCDPTKLGEVKVAFQNKETTFQSLCTQSGMQPGACLAQCGCMPTADQEQRGTPAASSSGAAPEWAKETQPGIFEVDVL